MDPDLWEYSDSYGYRWTRRIVEHYLWDGYQWRLMLSQGPDDYPPDYRHPIPLGPYDGTPAPPYAWSAVWGLLPSGYYKLIVTSQNF